MFSHIDISQIEISTLTWSGVSFFLGLILGHRLNLWREKRKEFNDLSAKVKDWRLMSENRALPFQSLDPLLRRAFQERLSGSKSARFGRAIRVLEEEFLYIRDIGNAGYVNNRTNEKVSDAKEDFRRITRLK
jgi:hypothetical protein